MDYKILNTIESPQQLKKLNFSELNILCSEIRDCIIDTVSKNGGHLASNLGTVELTVALHRVFDCPKDSILFDVGHQSYTHKLLTGRFHSFNTLRSENGISGFTDPKESDYDAFISGHSSSAVSAAYGIYKAKKLNGENGTAVAVVGDGAMTGGMVFEAINNIGEDKAKFLIVLNDNEMSISQNVGSLARHLNKIRSKSSYHTFKDGLARFLNSIPLIGKWLHKLLFRSKTVLKNAIYHSNVFEGLGLNYLGPVDGHNLKDVINLLNIAKNQERPTILHVVTAKGKGYKFAEENAGKYHGVGPFDPQCGVDNALKRDYSSVAGETLCELADADKKICAITAAMSEGTGLSDFAQRFPERFFDVGIAEQHAMTFAAGLAKGGLSPYFAVYSSFLQRAYDQIIHDVAIDSLPVKILVDRAGLVGEDGKTHHGLFDISFLTSIPDMTVYSPASFDELKEIIKKTAKYSTPVAVRYPRGKEINSDLFKFTDRNFDVFGADSDTAIVTFGRLSYFAYEASNENNVSFIKLNKLSASDSQLTNTLFKFNKICFFEEGIRSGGISEQIASKLCENGFKGQVIINAIDNDFVSCATVESQLKKYNLDKNAMLGVTK